MKNSELEHDTDMHRTKKDDWGYFDMKVHIYMYAQTGLAHSMVTTAANESDVGQTHRLLHGGTNMRGASKDCVAKFIAARRRSTYYKLEEADPVCKPNEKAEHAKANIC